MIQGEGDLRLAEQLASLKARHPSRVTLLMGNRDIIKMKLTSDLHPSEYTRPVEALPGPYWVSSEKRVSPAEFLRELDPPAPDTPANRLRYYLKCTMGAEGAFEFRRRELKGMRRTRGEVSGGASDVSEVSDEVTAPAHPPVDPHPTHPERLRVDVVYVTPHTLLRY
jgi:hypothetical protein